jgi:two-component system CheB/CheR fusion protein
VTYRQYAAYLDEHPDEYNRLVDVLTINVTEFFRDSEMWDRFAKAAVPRLLDEKSQRDNRLLRVWCAGCATGEEAYTIAMILSSEIALRETGPELSVFGTDLDPAALAAAKQAVYPIERLEQIPRRFRLGTVDVDRTSFRISRPIRDRVRFRRLNLFEDEPISMVDVISCRNVFIYFTREQQRQVGSVFWSALNKGGYLILGRSEKLPLDLAKKLELVDGRERIYRKPR